MKPIALNRIKGGLLRRIFLRQRFVDSRRVGPTVGRHEREREQRARRASYFSAIYEAAERMSPRERSAWREDGTLPDGFWEWVETRAASWDSLPP